ncbi:hypothetical protein HAX39_25190 [Citrobacter freundii]|nr:hypothetical protein [Citrobacter freundii]
MPNSLLRVDADDVSVFTLSASSRSPSEAIKKFRSAIDAIESGTSQFAQGVGNVMLINNEVKATSRYQGEDC